MEKILSFSELLCADLQLLQSSKSPLYSMHYSDMLCIMYELILFPLLCLENQPLK